MTVYCFFFTNEISKWCTTFKYYLFLLSAALVVASAPASLIVIVLLARMHTSV